NTSAQISSPAYFLGSEQVTFQIKPPFNSVLQRKDLGLLDNNDDQTIKNIITRLNPNLNPADLQITDIKPISAKISSPAYFLGSEQVTFRIKPPFNSVLQRKDLGLLDNNDDQTIKNIITRLNPNLNPADLQITDIKPISAKISSPAYFLGSEQVTFRIKPPFNSVLQRKDLGLLDNNDVQTIKNIITRLNPNLNPADLQITDIKPTSAQISSPVYFLGSEQVTFQIKPPFNSVLQRKNLGLLDNNEPQNIKNIITRLNPNLNPADLQITDIKPTSAQISSHYKKKENCLNNKFFIILFFIFIFVFFKIIFLNKKNF
ncbi:MAG: hypothetical protein Q8885_01245, partial [Candidatus Phytoplasma stylosanthis]|nr:hypothetical protein [Candidatus Phytoplasma stylosanthis]